MDIAGVVLGGIPLLLYALDNYQRCLQPGKDYWRYNATLGDIRTNVFLQQKQLEATLHTIGIRKQQPTHQDLHSHLLQRYSQEECEHFMQAITQMERIVEQLLDKLDVDKQGKPRWTSDNSERAQWEWRKIRRSFGRKAREKSIDELQDYNNALKNIFEAADISTDHADYFVKEVQARFDQQGCSCIRDNALSLYTALTNGIEKCGYPYHRGRLGLNWHREKRINMENLTLAIRMSQLEGWKRYCIRFPGTWEVAPPNPPSSNVNVGNSNPPPAAMPEGTWHRVMGMILGIGKESSTQPRSINLAPMPSTLAPGPIHPRLSCICEFPSAGPSGCSGTGLLPLTSEQDKTFLIERLDMSSGTDNFRKLKSLLPQTAQRKRGKFSLPRRHRFAIAAAACWTVLYLCGSPWLPEDKMAINSIQLPFEDLSDSSLGPAYYPVLPYRLDREEDDSEGEEDDNEGSLGPRTEAMRFQNGQVRNKALFSLGILLIELCLNRTFESLRRDHRESDLAASMGVEASLTDDFEIAKEAIDAVYDEAGDAYGDAVKKCLYCAFPGRDVTHDFSFRSFRKHFFDGVVAPVQAVYERQMY